MPAPVISDVTSSTVDGNGVFDVLMRSVNAHIHQEYKKDRLKGPEYSAVYLAGLQTAIDQAMRFVFERQNVALLEQQVLLAEKQVLKTIKDIELVQAQIAKMNKDEGLTEAQRLKVIAETLNVPKQGAILDQEVLNKIQQVAMSTKQVETLTAELVNIPKQGAILDQQVINLASEDASVIARTALTDKQTLNEITQNTVLLAQECKLRAEYNLLVEQLAEVAAKTALLGQRKTTETAQTDSSVIGTNSILGKQAYLYQNQADGFLRDAEQKAADIMTGVWKIDKTVGGLEVTTTTANGLNDGNIKTAVDTMLAGI